MHVIDRWSRVLLVFLCSQTWALSAHALTGEQAQAIAIERLLADPSLAAGLADQAQRHAHAYGQARGLEAWQALIGAGS